MTFGVKHYIFDPYSMAATVTSSLADKGSLIQICVEADEPNSCDMEEVNKLQDQVDNTTPTGSTPLHFVALGKNIQLAQWLIDNKATFVANESGETPFHWACKVGFEPMVTLFLYYMPKRFRSRRDNNNKSAKKWAKDFDQTHIVTLLTQERHKQLANSRKHIVHFFSKLTGSQSNVLIENKS